ncbi:hypothetical protein [Nostoc sp. C117]|uniref:hypothetical protein n=1 Tax=Nostoc sp. C117 TaxID=3349875 RepID=UPI00370D62F5
MLSINSPEQRSPDETSKNHWGLGTLLCERLRQRQAQCIAGDWDFYSALAQSPATVNSTVKLGGRSQHSGKKVVT